MADLQTSIELSLKDKVTGPLGGIKGAFSQFAEGLEKTKKAFEMSAAVKLTADAFKDLGENISRVTEKPKELARDVDEAYGDLQRSSHLTGKSFSDLKAQLEEAGKGTRFDYQDLASNLNLLTKRSGDAQIALKQLKDIEALAEGGKMDLSQATELTSMTMVKFGDATGNAAKYADLMVKAAQVGGVKTIAEMGQAIESTALNVKKYGGNAAESIPLLAGLTSVTKNAGDSAAALNIIYEHMGDPRRGRKLAVKGLELLGLSTDVNAQIKNLPKLIDDVSKATAKMTDDKRVTFFKGIFGTADPRLMAGHMQELSKSMKDSEGSSEALAKSVGGGANAAHERLEAAQKRLQQTMGSSLVGSGKVWDDMLVNLIGHAESLAKDHEILVGGTLRFGGSVGKIAEGVAIALPALATLGGAKGLAGLPGLFSKATSASGGFLSALGKIGAVAGAGAAGFAIGTAIDEYLIKPLWEGGATQTEEEKAETERRVQDTIRQNRLKKAFAAREAQPAAGAGTARGQLGVNIHVDSEGKARVTKVRTTGNLHHDMSITGLQGAPG